MQAEHAYLYVEDDPMSQEVMQLLMEHVAGIQQLTIFSDSRDFMQRLRALKPRPDVILLDIYVEPEDGFTLLRRLRADPEFAGVRVLAVTASVMTNEVSELRASGFDGVLAKPLDMDTFPALIRRFEAGDAVWEIR